MSKDKKNTPKYIEEFNKKFVNHGEFIYNKGSYPATSGDVLAFITKTIESERERVIGEMVKLNDKELHCGWKHDAINEFINKLKKK